MHWGSHKAWSCKLYSTESMWVSIQSKSALCSVYSIRAGERHKYRGSASRGGGGIDQSGRQWNPTAGGWSRDWWALQPTGHRAHIYSSKRYSTCFCNSNRIHIHLSGEFWESPQKKTKWERRYLNTSYLLYLTWLLLCSLLGKSMQSTADALRKH